jgi:hypothetical protein
MRRTYVLIVVVFGMAVPTFAETPSRDSETREALRSEVRQLPDDLQVSLTGWQAPKFCCRGSKEARITIG